MGSREEVGACMPIILPKSLAIFFVTEMSGGGVGGAFVLSRPTPVRRLCGWKEHRGVALSAAIPKGLELVWRSWPTCRPPSASAVLLELDISAVTWTAVCSLHAPRGSCRCDAAHKRAVATEGARGHGFEVYVGGNASPPLPARCCPR